MSKQLNIKRNLFKIINNAIDTEAYTDQEFSTIAEKCQYVLKCFESEYECVYEKQRQPNKTLRIAGWLQGLPSVCTVPFYYNEIIEIGYSLDLIKKVVRKETQEKEEIKFCESWFELMAHKLIQMSEMKQHAEKQFQQFLDN